MVSVNNRLTRLEQDAKDLAAVELRRKWASLTDKEVAELLAPYADWSPINDTKPQEREIEKKLRALMPEELIATALGLKDGMADEEVNRRLRSLLRGLGFFERGDSIRRYMLAPSAGGDE